MTAPVITDPLNSGNYPGDGPLRVGGMSPPPSLTPTNAQDLPSTLSHSAAKQVRALELMRDLWAGTEKLRDRSTIYLPKAPGEDIANYNIRLLRSVFFNATRHTVEGLTGFIFRRDPVLGDDVPQLIADQWENIDNAGTHGDVFAREQLQDGLLAGHNAILVEFPKTGGIQTAADESTVPVPVRPYWVPIRKDNILSWRTEVENGVTILTQVVLKECTMVETGNFGEKEQTRYRVLFRENGQVGFRLLEITPNKTVVEVDAGLYLNQDEIPIAECITSGRKGIFESDPPLLDLAYLNVAHYQQQSDYFTSIHKTCVPVFVTIGAEMKDDAGNTLVIGPNSALSIPQGGDAKYVSHTGQALGECKNALDALKGDMATLGLAMLAQDKRVAETAQAKRIDKAKSDSSLAVTARGLQDGLERALHFHARYLKLDDGGSVTINRDFENLALDGREIAALSQLVAQGQLTVETLWKMLAEGNVLPEDFDAEEEKANLVAEAELARVTAQEDARIAAENANPDVAIKNPDGSVKAVMSRQRAA